MLLCPTEEEGMVKAMAEKKVVVNKIKIKESKTTTIQSQLQSFMFQDPELKYLGQRAFISYLKSIYIQKNKDIFQVGALPVERFADCGITFMDSPTDMIPLALTYLGLDPNSVAPKDLKAAPTFNGKRVT